LRRNSLAGPLAAVAAALLLAWIGYLIGGVTQQAAIQHVATQPVGRPAPGRSFKIVRDAGLGELSPMARGLAGATWFGAATPGDPVEDEESLNRRRAGRKS